MKKRLSCIAVALCICAICGSAGEVDRLIASYDPIQTVACKYRRTIRGAGPDVVFLSRIYFSRDDRLHVENLSPVKRRIVSDGEIFSSYAEGDPKGFSRPVAQLDETMLISLRRVPGTPMEHLLRMRGGLESRLGELEEGGSRWGVELQKRFAVMHLDAQGRLTRLEFFQDKTQNTVLATYRYSRFQEVLPGVWVPFRHEGEVVSGGERADETVRLDEYTVNIPLAKQLFNRKDFFDVGIDFVDDFDLIYGQPGTNN